MSFLVERSRTTRRVEEGGSGTLRYGRRLAGALDVFGSVSAWSRVLGGTEQRGWSWSAGLRQRFDGPRRPFSRGGVVEGRVVQDATGLGRPGAASAPEAGVRVRLEDGREALTDAEGRFRFNVNGAGPHRVEVVLPTTAGAYFTTPSVITAAAGDRIEFGVSRTPARLTGALRDDAGAGIAGATVSLSGPTTLSSRTDSSGRFSFAGPEGDYTLAIDAASLPPGYDLSRLDHRPIRLTRDLPAHEAFVVRAFRSISGSVRWPPVPGRLVWLVEPWVRREVGPDGRYVFRDLAPGRYTIAVHAGDRFERRVIDVPAGPATIRDVDFGPASR